jgi:ACS family hexuronate transporter-like MFS transporter
METQGTDAGLQPVPAAGNYRWGMCALLFFAATVNYVDRQVIGLLKPTLQSQLGWSEIDYSNIIFAFQLAYAIGLLVVGRIMDWLGTRKGFSIAVFVWSVAAMCHAIPRTVFGFAAARFSLGLGESGSFPASIKAIAEWFPKKERALATGFFNSGTNVGAIVTPLAIPWLTYRFGWQGAFIATGALGFVWILLWLLLYEHPDRHKQVSAAEIAYIRSDPADPPSKVEWRQLLRYRQLWAFMVCKFMTDPIWWLYLFWIPDFLNRNFHVNLLGMMLPLLIIYNMASIGSIGGGWLSGLLIRRGWTVNGSRKFAMLVGALAVVPIVYAAKTPNMYTAVLLLGIATAAHQGWMANVFTTASDMFPRRAVGTVVGIGGMAGAVGGMLIAKIVGYVLAWTGSYFLVFLIAGSAYLVALLIFHLLVPRLEPALVE